MAKTLVLEIVFRQDEWPFEGLDEVEDPLDQELMEWGVGQVVGGRVGGGSFRLRVEATDLHGAVAVIRRVLRELGAPRSTVINAPGAEATPSPIYGIYED